MQHKVSRICEKCGHESSPVIKGFVSSSTRCKDNGFEILEMEDVLVSGCCGHSYAIISTDVSSVTKEDLGVVSDGIGGWGDFRTLLDEDEDLISSNGVTEGDLVRVSPIGLNLQTETLSDRLNGRLGDVTKIYPGYDGLAPMARVRFLKTKSGDVEFSYSIHPLLLEKVE